MKNYQALSSGLIIKPEVANFGLDNSSYRAQPHSIIVNCWVPTTVLEHDKTHRGEK
jgi:hypothetical protein